jgi:DNA-binding transcriptional MerR regulator/methylmalonyl-CoA mutase cobalamin-binding subunit
MIIPIRTVCALTGVNPITLRAWERRYALIEPHRTPSGHRAYTDADVERIRKILALTRDGVSIGQVKEALDAEPIVIPPTSESGPWPGYRRRLAAAIAVFDESALEAIYHEALALHSVNTVDRMLLMPMLADLGSRWSKVTGGVAEEHFFSAYLRNKIGARFHHRRALERGKKILMACGPGELHEIGLLLFALAAHAVGFRVVLLGANVPFAEIAAAAHGTRCNAIVISSTMDHGAREFFADLSALVSATKRPVFVGGNIASVRETEIQAAGAVPLAACFDSALRRVSSEIDVARERK